MKRYPIEALLRPAFEWQVVPVAIASAVVFALFPATFVLSSYQGYGLAAACAALGLRNLWRGYRIVRYRRYLRRAPSWTMRPNGIPISPYALFLGRGFLWDERHTQRMVATQTPAARALLKPGFADRLARRLEQATEGSALGKILRAVFSANLWCNPFKPGPDVGGEPALHGVGLHESRDRPVKLSMPDRQGHMLVVGTTGVGKTRCAELYITQDIRRGDVVIVLDPKGDAELLANVYRAAKSAGRLDQLYIFHLGHPESSARYNPVGDFGRITEVATRIAGQLPGQGQSAAFREFVWRYVNGIARAINALGKRVDYRAILEFGQDIEPLAKDYLSFLLDQSPHTDWRERLAKLDHDALRKTASRTMKDRDPQLLGLIAIASQFDIHDTISEALLKTVQYDRNFYDKLVASLLPLMEKLCTGQAAELLSPDYSDRDDPRKIFDWLSVIRTRSIVYVGLDALSDPEVAAAVGSSMFADLTSLAGRIYKHGLGHGLPDIERDLPRVQVHADEFNEIIGPEFIPMLNKSRGAGFVVTAYTQTLADIEARLQDRAKAAQVIGNFNAILMFRVPNKKTAEILTDLVDEITVQTQMQVSGASDSARPDSSVDFTSATQIRIGQERVPAISPAQIARLPKGQCFAYVAGGKLYKLRLPYIKPGDTDRLPKTLQGMVATMRVRHASAPSRWADFEPSWSVA